jgi:hypothetical protein
VSEGDHFTGEPVQFEAVARGRSPSRLSSLAETQPPNVPAPPESPAKHISGRRYFDAGSPHLLHIVGQEGIGAAVETAAVDLGQCPGVVDHARLRDIRDDIGRPRNRCLISKDRG